MSKISVVILGLWLAGCTHTPAIVEPPMIQCRQLCSSGVVDLFETPSGEICKCRKKKRSTDEI